MNEMDHKVVTSQHSILVAQRDRLLEAAITVVNCYQWDGEERAKYLAEAVNELDKLITTIEQSVKNAGEEGPE